MSTYISSRMTLFVVISVLLAAPACTPENVRNERTSTTIAHESGDSNSAVTMVQTTKPAEEIFRDTGSPTPEMKREELKVQMSTPLDRPKPLEISNKPKAKAQPKLVIVTKPKAKPKKTSLDDGTKKTATTSAAQKKPEVKTTLPVTSESAPSRDLSLESGAKEKASVVLPPALKQTSNLNTPASDTVTVAASESMDDQLELAMLTRQKNLLEEASAGKPTMEITTLDIAALPLTFGADWSLDRRPNPIDQETQCLLASRSVNISDGYDRTDVQLLLTANSLYVRTESNLDLSYPDTGMRLDNGALVPFDGLAKETAAKISADVAMLYEQMIPSRTVHVRLGFWPTWPVTKTQEASFTLDGFERAIKALWLCEKM